MKVHGTRLDGVLQIEGSVFRDARGSFRECWTQRRYGEIGIAGPFVQDNASTSTRGVLRGLHYQLPHPQAKLVSVLHGEIFDVAVDLRPESATFGRWFGCTLSGENGRQLYIPEGLAHGFQVLSAEAVVMYKCTDYYHPEAEGTLLWDDPELGIEWPLPDPIVSEKDRRGLRLRDLCLRPTEASAGGR